MEHNSITEADLNELHDEFIIFGDPESPYWFLGLEEAVSKAKNESIDEFVYKLLEKTRKFVQKQKMSLRDFGVPQKPKCFLPLIDPAKARSASDTKYQSTWGGYIKLLLSIDSAKSGKSWNLNDVKIYQKYRLGALAPPRDPLGSCLLELFPLGRKNRKEKKWQYEDLSNRNGLEYLESPVSYQIKVETARVKLLLRNLKIYQPTILVCFGADCKNAVRKVLMSTDFEILRVDQGKRMVEVSITKYTETLIVFSNHPTSYGMSNLYWKNLGIELADRVDGA